MERIPGIPIGPEGNASDDDDETEKSKKKRSSFRAPLPISDKPGEANKETPKEAPKSPLDALADSLKKKDGASADGLDNVEAASVASNAGEAEAETLEIDLSEPDGARSEQADASAEQPTDEGYIDLEPQERPADAEYAGELLIGHGDENLEGTIPLEPGEAGQVTADAVNPEATSQGLPPNSVERYPSDPAASAPNTAPGSSNASTQRPTVFNAPGLGQPSFGNLNSAPSVGPNIAPGTAPATNPNAAPIVPPYNPNFATPPPNGPNVPPTMWANYNNMSPNAPSSPYVQPGEQAASKQEVADAVRAAKANGLRQGVVTGLFVGGVYEHFKHKRREEKREKQIELHKKQLAEARKAYAQELETNTLQRAEQQRTNIGVQERLSAAEAASKAKLAERVGVEKITGARPVVAVPEQLAVPSNHRIETSAWHAIEVDAKTGKAVEKPTFQYGREYYRERAQETAPLAQKAAVAGGVALVGAATAGGSKGQDGTDASSASHSQGTPPPNATTQAKLSPKDGRGGAASTDKPSGGPLWLWLLALLVIIGCIFAAL